MNKILTSAIAILLLTGLILGNKNAHASTFVTGKRIVIDAGHGGTDPGAVNQALHESDIALDIARQLKTKLEADGAVVGMTRDCDCTRSNADRYNYANAFKGDVLVSIHLNGSTDSNADGTQGLYGQKNKDQGFTVVLHNAMVSKLGIQDRGVTNFASGTLLKSNMPATIQETVFLSSSAEYPLLLAGTRQVEIADGLYQGLNIYFSQPVQTGRTK